MVTELGIVMDFRYIHQQNALDPIYVTPLGIVIVDTALSQNAPDPILLNVEGSSTDDKFTHPLNVLSFISVTPFGIVMELNDLQY